MSNKYALTIKYDLILRPVPPFNFEGTVHKPSHFPSSDEYYFEGQYWQTMRLGDTILGIKMADNGPADDPQVILSVYSRDPVSAVELETIRTEVEYRFDMKADLSEFHHDCESDRLLGPVLERWRGTRVSAGVSLYEYLVIATVLQNATVRRSVRMLEALFQQYGSKASFNGKQLSVFWTAKSMNRVNEEELRSLKVGYRAKTLKKQAEAFVSGQLDEDHLRTTPTEDLRASLLRLYGIGPASVQYLLFDVFKRYDALDHISPWEQKIYSRLLFDEDLVDSEIILDEVRARWGKWRMLAVHYLFEDLFWQSKAHPIPWLEKLIRS